MSAAAQPLRLASRFAAELVWTHEAPSRPGDRFWLRRGTRDVLARIRTLERIREPGSSVWREPVLGEATLAPNSVARVEIETQQPLALAPCEESRSDGAFLLVDAESDRTVADGTIRCGPEPIAA